MRERIVTGPVPPSWRKARTPGCSSSVRTASAAIRRRRHPRTTGRGTGSGPGRGCRSPGPRLADEAGTRTITSGQPGPIALDCRHGARPQAVQRRRGPPVVEDGARPCTMPSSIEAAAPPTTRAAAGVEHHDVAVGAALAVQHPPGQAGVGGRVPAPQVRRLGQGQPQVTQGRRTVVVTSPSRSSNTVEGPVVVSSSRPSWPWTSRTCWEPWALRTASMRSASEHVGHPEQHPPDPAGVGQRSEDVERRAGCPSPAGPGRRGAAPGGSGGPGRSRCRRPRRSGPRRRVTAR